ncbi:MAG: GntR family transcriptional regulator [Ornithinimicrobium sp.]
MTPPSAFGPAGRVVDSSVLAIVSRLALPRPPVSLAEAVDHRISTAIAIGLLQTGDRLPSEEVMAHVLGVSGLTFRQALGRLRVRRLVTTRPGRGGGTVISPRPQDLEALAKAVFESNSASYIADLGTTFAGLFSQGARLAALRHDQFDDARLDDVVRSLAEAVDPVHRRRASTLFIVTVASAARSETLMDILVPVIGALQSMVWLDESDPLVEEIVDDAIDVLRLIKSSAPEAAGRRSREHGERLTSHLVTRRAGQYAMGERACEGGFDGLLRRIDGVRSTLAQVAADLSHLEPTRTGRATSLDALFCDAVDAHDDLVRGAGIAYAPDLLTDRPLWMDWWDSDSAEGLSFKSHTFSNASLQYYDYRRMAWFTEPLRTGEFSAHGPYLDRGGIERVTITLSLPLTTPAFAGSVLGADLRLGRLGEVFFGDSQPEEGGSTLLVDAHERVVASAVPGLMPGDVVAAGRAREFARIDPAQWPGLAQLGWHTARLG